MKLILKRLGLLGLLFVGAYAIVVGYTFWKWFLPHQNYPAGYEQAGEQVLFVKEYSALASNIESLIQLRAKEWSAPSISASFSVDDQIIWSGTSGFADFENNAPATIHSRYRAGSVSKSLTSLALARIIDQGLLNVDSPIQSYLPDYPKHQTAVTSRMLGSHTSGIRHYNMFTPLTWPPSEFLMEEQFDTVTQTLSVFDSDELLFEPNTNFSYSTYGYSLLSAVMEAATDSDYLTLMQTEVFTPLGMKDTRADKFDAVDQQRVKFYSTGKNKYGETYPANLSVKWAGGGFLSTPTDLVKAGVAVTNEEYFSEATRNLLLTPIQQAVGGRDPKGYGIGWVINHYTTLDDAKTKVKVYSHSGGSLGGQSFLTVLPDQKIVVAVQTNTMGHIGGPKMDGLAKEIVKVILKHLDDQFPTS